MRPAALLCAVLLVYSCLFVTCLGANEAELLLRTWRKSQLKRSYAKDSREDDAVPRNTAYVEAGDKHDANRYYDAGKPM